MSRIMQLCALIGLVSTCSTAEADLILKLSGTNGSNVVNYEASGSVTITNGTSGLNSGLGLAPISGNWSSGFDNNLGDILRTGASGSFNDDLALSNGGVSYRRNGTEFGVLDTIDLDPDDAAGGDDIELDPTSSISYPTLQVGDVLSWTGSGTFNLDGGETFDTLFDNHGTFMNAIDGGNYVVNVSFAAVPEPSSIFLLSSGLAGYVFYRRRKKRQAEATEETIQDENEA